MQRYGYKLVTERMPAWLVVKHEHNQMPAWGDCAKTFVTMFPHDGREHFGVLALDAHLTVMGGQVLSSGDIDKVMLAPRTLFQWALGVPNCAHVIVAHNHPTGDVTPSEPDKRGTAALSQAGRMVDITVLGSLVVTHLSDNWQLIGQAEKPREPEAERPDPKPQPEGDEGDEQQDEPEADDKDGDDGEPEDEKDQEGDDADGDGGDRDDADDDGQQDGDEQGDEPGAGDEPKPAGQPGDERHGNGGQIGPTVEIETLLSKFKSVTKGK